MTGTAYLRAVVVLDRDPAHEVPELVEVPLIDGLLAVIAQSSSLPLLDRPLHRLAELCSGSGGPFVLRYREIGDCVGIVHDLLTVPASPAAARASAREPSPSGSERRPWSRSSAHP